MVADLVRQGWRPPPLTDDQAERLLDDIYAVGEGHGHRRTLDLTPLERDVLYRFAEGATTQEIADTTKRDFETVKTYLARARAKLGARNTVHAVAIAISQEEIGPVD